MFLHKKRVITMIFIAWVLSVINIHACLTTFIHDGSARIIIFNEDNKDDETLIPIRRHEKRRFGNAHKHAHFVIFIQEPPQRIFTKAYTCKQNTCGTQGNIELKFSDIKNNTGAARLFTITKHDQHYSMAQQVADEVKKCSACGEE